MPPSCIDWFPTIIQVCYKETDEHPIAIISYIFLHIHNVRQKHNVPIHCKSHGCCPQWLSCSKIITPWLFIYSYNLLMYDLNRTPIVMAKHGGSRVHFSGISTCERTSREIVSHPQRPPLGFCTKYLYPSTLFWQIKLKPLTTTWYNSLVLYYSLLKI